MWRWRVMAEHHESVAGAVDLAFRARTLIVVMAHAMGGRAADRGRVQLSADARAVADPGHRVVGRLADLHNHAPIVAGADWISCR